MSKIWKSRGHKLLVQNSNASDIARPRIEEYRPFGTLSNIDSFDYTAKLRYGRGPWSSFSQKARENGLVTPSSLLSFVPICCYISFRCFAN